MLLGVAVNVSSAHAAATGVSPSRQGERPGLGLFGGNGDGEGGAAQAGEGVPPNDSVMVESSTEDYLVDEPVSTPGAV